MPLYGFNQQPGILNVTLSKKLRTPVKDFTVDNLGNIYLLTPSNQIKKLDANGDSVAVYNDVRRYGKIYSIDATNPFKILAYYKEFSTIIILDRLLNVRSTIDLRQQNILQVRVVATSYDNNIWVFDELDSRLKKIDDTGKVLFTSNDFRQVFENVPIPETMFDRDGQLYLYDPKTGLLVFDYYGAKKNNYLLLNVRDLEVIDKNTITARDSADILLYKPATLQTFSFSAFKDQSVYSKIKFNGKLLYCLTNDDELLIYRVIK